MRREQILVALYFPFRDFVAAQGLNLLMNKRVGLIDLNGLKDKAMDSHPLSHY